MKEKFVYLFSEGSKDMQTILGTKGANLAEMSNLELPVPFGITITAKACNSFYENGEKISEEISSQIFEYLKTVEENTNLIFGDSERPLLLSVRSGAAVPMPGMMDTILNLGLNDITVIGLAKCKKNYKFAYDCYRRFIQMYSDVVVSIPKYKFDYIMNSIKTNKKYSDDTELTKDDLIEVINKYKVLYKKETGCEFPQDPKIQLIESITAVFKSWNNLRAKTYRKLYNIEDSIGTAVNIQSMVYGNLGSTSATGVAFTRNPSTGEKYLYGEYLLNAQGEDVVSGISTPKRISLLEDFMPDVYNRLEEISHILEKHYKDMQDIEFTIENGNLYILQTRTAKRTANAAIRVAVEMVEEGLISKEEAILRIDPKSLDQLLHPTFDSDTQKLANPIAKGLPASPGAASGYIYFNADEAIKAAKNGEKVILVRKETSPEDIEGMTYSEGILTSRGGMTSHAAVVARGMGKCCVAGCEDIYVDEELKILIVNGKKLKEHDSISLDGSLGLVYEGVIKSVNPLTSGYFNTIMKWADNIRKLKIKTNADTALDVQTAINFGAEGIGLCRTEHMFFDEERIIKVRRMILADSLNERNKAIDELLPLQKEDFKKLYKIIGEKPMTIRLLDLPLHEFVPSDDDDIKKLADILNINYIILKERINSLCEFNPMMGHRGCRLLITYPEIAKMQIKAIILAAIEVNKENNIHITPEIMIPLISDSKEFVFLKNLIIDTTDNINKLYNTDIHISVGAMIEVPRACVTSHEIAEHADFFSYGTNDLTQMTYGFSRDDSGKFIGDYRDLKIFENDPFKTIDKAGVGELIKTSIKLGRISNPAIKLGICGEHGGDTESIKFFNILGLDYVSCSPYRVPLARLAAAQATIIAKK